jgi:universal stress protein E
MGKILVIADIEDSCNATPRGLQLARLLGHSVEVVAFTHASLKRMDLTATKQATVKKQLLAFREKSVQARIDKYTKSDQNVSLKVVWEKDIPRWLSKHISSTYDMVVKTGSRSGSIVHTSTDWQLIRECPVPVLIVARKRWHRVRPVLAALDLGSRSRQKRKLNHQVLATAITLAEALDAELKLICAVEIPTLLSDLDLVEPGAYVKDAKSRMKPHIGELAKKHGLPESSFRIKRGPVDKVISSDAARERAQLVVIGTVARRGVKARLLGNTAEAVLRYLKTDVLALKPGS